MRQSKSRSRNKNRNSRPSGGNIINRVFDSSGPDGKVRGTPSQVIEKYNQLHRDAQLSGDRVAAENHAQHAEHYTRILAAAQREVDRQKEEQETANRERQAERDRERTERLRAQEAAANASANMDGDQPNGSDSGLVETPEMNVVEDEPKPKPRKRTRRPRKDDVSDAQPSPDQAPQPIEDAVSAPEAPVVD